MLDILLPLKVSDNKKKEFLLNQMKLNTFFNVSWELQTMSQATVINQAQQNKS